MIENSKTYFLKILESKIGQWMQIFISFAIFVRNSGGDLGTGIYHVVLVYCTHTEIILIDVINHYYF